MSWVKNNYNVKKIEKINCGCFLTCILHTIHDWCLIGYIEITNLIKFSLEINIVSNEYRLHRISVSNAQNLLADDKEEKNPLRIPTKYNIQMALRWLIEGCRSGDSLVFHFSGHGTQELDLNMDEIDGYDEAICPVDYEHQGKILDDEINATIVWPLPHGAKLHAIMDACHSGTVLDLPFVCKMNRLIYQC